MDHRDRSWQDNRESIWSVDRSTKNLYFALFIVQSIVGIGLLTWATLLRQKSPLETAVIIWQGAAPIIGASAGNAIVTTESGRSLMVLARSLEEWLEKRREADLAEGRAEANAKWVAWNNRRIAAEQNNEPFDEPPPAQRQLTERAGR